MAVPRGSNKQDLLSGHSVGNLSDTVKSTTQPFEEQMNSLLDKDEKVNTSVPSEHVTKTIEKFFYAHCFRHKPQG